MKIIRVHVRKKSRAFALPVSIRQKVALLLRGWRPAYLPHVPVPWWSKPVKAPRQLLALARSQV